MNQNIVNLFTSVINSMEFVYIIYKAFEKGLPICLSSLPSVNTYTSDGWIPALSFLTPWHIRNASRKTLCTEEWNRSAWVWGLEMWLSFFWQDPRMGSTCHSGRGSQTSAVPCLVALVTPGSLGFLLPLQFSSVQLLSRARLFVTPWTAARQASLSVTNSRSLLMSIESVMPSNHLILCHPLLLLPSIFPSIRVFSNESALRIRWQKY